MGDYSDLKHMLIKLVDMLRKQDDTPWDWSPNCKTRQDQTALLRGKKLLTHGPLHFNKSIEICVCLEGHAYLQLEDRMVVLEPGQFFAVMPRTLHNECIPADEDCTDVWLNLRQDQRIRAVVAGRDEDEEFGIMYVRAVLVDPLLKSLLKETLEKELESDEYGSRVLVKNRMVDAMIGMIRQLELEDQGQTVKHWQQSVVSEVMDYLHHHSTDRVELQDLADHMAISVKHLNRIFKTATGSTIVSYANNIRIDQAKYYLTTTDLKIKDIAQLLNYYDQYHFGRIFKNATGKSPMEFRKSKREE